MAAGDEDQLRFLRERSACRPEANPSRVGNHKDRLLPLALHIGGAGVVFEHQAATVDAFTILAPAPIGVVPLVLPTSAALFRVEVTPLVIQVDGALAPVTPDDRLMRSIYFDLEGHVRVAG